MSPQPRGRRGLTLSAARLLCAIMYIGSLGVYIAVGSTVKRPPVTGIPDFFPWVMLGVGVADYVVSLLLESFMLDESRLRASMEATPARTAEGTAATTAIIVSAFGVSIAVYGVILALMSFTAAAWYLYSLAAMHGIHLQLRWDRYDDAVQRALRYAG